MALITQTNWWLALGQLPKWTNGTDCKSVAKASKVRILHCPPYRHQISVVVCPCGAGVAHILGKNEAMGSNPITGSRGLFMCRPASSKETLGTELRASRSKKRVAATHVESRSLVIHIHSKNTCCRLLIDRHLSSLFHWKGLFNNRRLPTGDGCCMSIATATCIIVEQDCEKEREFSKWRRRSSSEQNHM